uniref:Phage tail protein n=1 Tax=Rodentolepis nana TaxID=102285 RepID=A0A0R3TYL5_RODNA
LALSDITDWPGIEAVADWPRIEAVAEFNFGQESKPLLSLDYVPDGLPGKTPSKIGREQLALSDITDWPGIEAVADWPRIEAVAEFNFGQESKPLLSLDYVRTDCLAKHLQRLGVYTGLTNWDYTLNPHALHVTWEYTLNPHAPYVT